MTTIIVFLPIVFGEKGAIDLSKGLLYQHGSDEVRELITPAVRDAEENAMSEFYACIREGRKPVADVTVAAVAALRWCCCRIDGHGEFLTYFVVRVTV